MNKRQKKREIGNWLSLILLLYLPLFLISNNLHRLFLLLRLHLLVIIVVIVVVVAGVVTIIIITK